MDATKYQIGYYPPPVEPGHVYEWTQKDHIETAPAWCSVDLRDGNQSLVVPMSLEEKLEFYDMLVRIGFKEIEVGFPAASETEYEFLRKLIDEDRIPEDVTIQVLTQCRDHIIRRTFEAVKGAPRAIIHFYNSTSEAQRREVFHKSKEEIKQIAVDGARLIKKLSQEYEGNFLFEYSPESFTGTEPEYAVEVCNAVLDVMQPTPDRPMIINLPVTVEMSMPHIYANQIEWCSKHLKYRDAVILSTHPHNDRGCGVADAELAVLADPAGVTELCGTHEDLLIPSSCLNSTVSGLISRTFLRDDIIGKDDFHGAVYYGELKDADLSYDFIRRIESEFGGETGGTPERKQDTGSADLKALSAAGAPDEQTIPPAEGASDERIVPPAAGTSGIDEVREIARRFQIGDINLIKPGIGEATRVLLRRVPWKILIGESSKGDAALTHLIRLAQEKGRYAEDF